MTNNEHKVSDASAVTNRYGTFTKFGALVVAPFAGTGVAVPGVRVAMEYKPKGGDRMGALATAMVLTVEDARALMALLGEALADVEGREAAAAAPKLDVIPGMRVEYQDMYWRVNWVEGATAGIQVVNGREAIKVDVSELKEVK